MVEVSPTDGGLIAAARAKGSWWSEGCGRRFGKQGDWSRRPQLDRLAMRIQQGVFFLVWLNDPMLEGCTFELSLAVVEAVIDACLKSGVDVVMELSPASKPWKSEALQRKDSSVVTFPWD